MTGVTLPHTVTPVLRRYRPARAADALTEELPLDAGQALEIRHYVHLVWFFISLELRVE